MKYTLHIRTHPLHTPPRPLWLLHAAYVPRAAARHMNIGDQLHRRHAYSSSSSQCPSPDGQNPSLTASLQLPVEPSGRPPPRVLVTTATSLVKTTNSHRLSMCGYAMNVTFPNGIGANRGIKLVLGEQIQGMRMSTIINNTRVRNILDCPSTNVSDLIGCQGASGSIYSTTDGSFDQVLDDSDWDVPTKDAQPNDGSTTVVRGYDIANFTDGPAVIPDYPLEVWANRESVNLSALALGPKSSTLERLVDNNLAPSTSFGLDYGSTSELFPRDGQLVIGGVNEARFDDDATGEFEMWGADAPANCPLQVLISDFILTNEDGDHSLLPDEYSKISACIDTIQNSFTLTDSMFEKFQEIGEHIDSDGSDYWPATFPANREKLLGSLTIRFANGYKSVIPHYELINHERGTDDQGKYAVLNNSRISAAVASGQSDLGANVPILGGVFLSQNYLKVDYEQKKFWLSPQVGNGTKTDKIATVCTETDDDTEKTPSATPTPEAASSTGMGVKVGVPVAVGSVAAIGIVAFLLWRRRRKQAAVKTAAVEMANNSPSTVHLQPVPPTSPSPSPPPPAPPTPYSLLTELESPAPQSAELSSYPMDSSTYPKDTKVPLPVESHPTQNSHPVELDAYPRDAAELDSRAV
ncbi:hypothetical protein G7Z17_g1088 [Cylindrodendrum hubeiense]|uniref:Peptidase A1 domain-containing protein n=1 Tax=Cylindrodendrum hubeiense TaxID=595255 RepID=A0A9P5HGG4_9HYPO|nr:hypothetical protein G7Z17_g1088 [Cylindrodendrum hubeiense]